MIPMEKMTDEEFQEHVLNVLGSQLGPYGLARYLRINHAGTGDYTRDRHKWQAGQTIDDILLQIREQNQAQTLDREAS